MFKMRVGPTPWNCTVCENEMRRSQCRTFTDGTQIYPEHRGIINKGPRADQQWGYVVLADEERAKGFVRPVRRSYKH